MFTARWSTIAVLSIAALAAMLGFYGGEMRQRAQVPPALADAARADIQQPTQPVTKTGPAQPTDTGAQSESLEDAVRKILAQAATPARNEALLAALEKLAGKNPLAAIALARNEANPGLRLQLLEAVFKGWGKADAVAAVDWILAQPEGSLDSNAAIAAMLKGAVQNPDAAVQLTQRLNAANPAQAREYGDALIYALGQNGGFQTAANFAASGSGDLRTEWLAAAYGNWANYQPQDAAASAMQIEDADTRTAALDAVIPDWDQSDPKGLANFAMGNLAEGDQKTRALSNALVYWAGDNVVEAANWVNQYGPGPEFDQGEAAIATQQEMMKQPGVAISWAEGITDDNLRSRTVAAIVESWALSNPAAALNFVQDSPDLQPDDRDSLLAKLNTPAGQ